MTIRELALNLIEHADETPGTIDLSRATEIIGWLDTDTDLPEDLTPEAFMDAWNGIIRDSARRISLDNGNTFLTAEDAAMALDSPENTVSWDAVTEAMDDDTREAVHAELAPCTNAEFLARYLQLAQDDLIVG